MAATVKKVAIISIKLQPDMSQLLYLVVPPTLVDISSDLAVQYNHNTTLHCTSSSELGDVSITWSTSIFGVLPQPTVIHDGNTTTSFITLESVDDSYSGDYSCNISNKFGGVVGNIFLSVICKFW